MIIQSEISLSKAKNANSKNKPTYFLELFHFKGSLGKRLVEKVILTENYYPPLDVRRKYVKSLRICKVSQNSATTSDGFDLSDLLSLS